MFGKLRWRIGLAAAVIIGIVTGPACLAQTTCTPYPVNANGPYAGGIYVQPGGTQHATVTVVNLTKLQLTSDPIVLMTQSGSGTYPFENVANSDHQLVIDVSRSKIWASGNNDCCWDNPRFDGLINWTLKDSSGNIRAAFAIDFQMQGAGTWISLGRAGWTGWCAPGAASATCGGVYRTEQVHDWGDYSNLAPSTTNNFNMHNIMTLANSQFIVALYAANNLQVVLVVREAQGDDYYGYRLNWVDHDSGVPGDCNQP